MPGHGFASSMFCDADSAFVICHESHRNMVWRLHFDPATLRVTNEPPQRCVFLWTGSYTRFPEGSLPSSSVISSDGTFVVFSGVGEQSLGRQIFSKRRIFSIKIADLDNSV